MNRTRVYAPETNEPFDVPSHKAADLILLKGWTQSPVERVAVSNVAPAPVFDLTADDSHDEPVSEEADAQVEAYTWRSGRASGRGRKTFGSEAAAV